MQKERFSRTENLLGPEAMERLAGAKVIIFGIGGVGGYVCEALCRSGIGSFDLVDSDTVAPSNLNRQIIATENTTGRYKTEVMKERMLSVNPEVKVREHRLFYLPENADEFDLSVFDYVIDAVDTVTAKIAIIENAKKAGTPVISCMGTGNKLHPEMLKIADIYDTKVCPLAKVMRHELRARNIKELKVVFSEEEPVKPLEGGRIPASTAFVPGAAGLLIASYVVRELASV